MADFLYRADLLPRGDVYTPYDTGLARVGSVFTLITVVNNNVKPCINREFNPKLPLGSAVLYTWPIFHHLCDYFILAFLRKRKRGMGNVFGVLVFFFAPLFFISEEYFLLGQLLSRGRKYWEFVPSAIQRYREKQPEETEVFRGGQAGVDRWSALWSLETMGDTRILFKYPKGVAAK